MGYALCSAVFSVTGASRNPTITQLVLPSGITDAATINSRWRTGLTGVGDPFSTSQMPSTLAMVETRVLYNNAGFLFSDVDTTVTQGAGSNAAPPMNVAVLVNKVTGLAGRKYRGRLFAPPTVHENTVTAAGQIDSSTLSTLQTQWNGVFTHMVAQDIPPYLQHQDGSNPTPLLSYSVSERVGTIGRRMRR